MQPIHPQQWVAQFLYTVKVYGKVPAFIRRKELWQGAGRYSWLTKFLMIAAIILLFNYMDVILDWFRGVRHASDIRQVFSATGSLMSDFGSKTYNLMMHGSMKYVLLILGEVFIFHFCRRTLELLHGDMPDPTFDDFIKAQIRMFKVGIFCMIITPIIAAMASIPLEMANMGFAKKPLQFIIECYFLGFAVIDNYHEQFHLSIKESAKKTIQYTGVALAIGIAYYGLTHVKIELIGTLLGLVVAPIVTAVVAAHAMYKFSDLHLQADLPPHPESSQPETV